MTRILHLSDPHFGAADPAIAEIFLQRAAALRPDITILSGDLTMRVRRRELIAAREFVERLPRPHLVIPGNHDIPLINQPFDRFLHPFRRYQDTFGGELEPELISNGVHVVSVNSSRAFGFHADWSEGRLSKRQLLRIQEKFQAGPDTHFRVLVLHHPLLELQIAGRAVVKPLKELLQALETARVDLVMCGHFHRSQIHSAGLTDQWKSIISQAPTVCSTRLQGEPQGFHEILVGAGRVEAIHHSYQRGDFVATGSSAFACDAAGWNYARTERTPME
ncbi:MAG: metallophosphoesterase [Verrucomicrobiota bacterium]